MLGKNLILIFTFLPGRPVGGPSESRVGCEEYESSPANQRHEAPGPSGGYTRSQILNSLAKLVTIIFTFLFF